MDLRHIERYVFLCAIYLVVKIRLESLHKNFYKNKNIKLINKLYKKDCHKSDSPQ